MLMSEEVLKWSATPDILTDIISKDDGRTSRRPRREDEIAAWCAKFGRCVKEEEQQQQRVIIIIDDMKLSGERLRESVFWPRTWKEETAVFFCRPDHRTGLVSADHRTVLSLLCDHVEKQ